MKNFYLTIKDAYDNLIASVKMSRNRMFTLNIQSDVLKCLNVIVKDEAWLWHLRFGHLNFGGLKLLLSKNMPVLGLGVMFDRQPLRSNDPYSSPELC
ncbi:hypothetical protein ACOSP7_026614 [Xanthoceras sorbifolium]